MKVIDYIPEDFVNYKKPSMYIAFPTCSFKCDRECGKKVCQNSTLAASPKIEVEPVYFPHQYLTNSITKAFVFAGLEPFDSEKDLLSLVHAIRNTCEIQDDIVIYTGYKEEELQERKIYEDLKTYQNIIVKFGRFIPDCEKHFDDILGVDLASPNQYAKLLI